MDMDQTYDILTEKINKFFDQIILIILAIRGVQRLFLCFKNIFLKNKYFFLL
jgi:hypothetical protein